MDEQRVTLSLDDGQAIRTIGIERETLYLIIEKGMGRLDDHISPTDDEKRALHNARNLAAWLRPVSDADFTIDDADESL